ncbi:MAG: methyltransferase domain-containing protein [Bacteroidota bacterium]|nr:methyltransferase domain-containing protein [Bacteroidota bacterium]
MDKEEYHKRIVEYYQATENAYKDSWDLDKSLAIHYGYRDEKVKSFPESLFRMNEVMAETAGITVNDRVLDAGCGVGGSSIFLASKQGCKVTGITLSERQAQQSMQNAKQKGVNTLVDFKVMDYCRTSFTNESFDIIWGCESICYADDKEQFVKEAWRLLKPGGRLIIADGFVTEFENNDYPVIRQWLDGWQVNYLESPVRFNRFMEQAGFVNIGYRDISAYTIHSSKRLLRFYWLASLYVAWKKMVFSNRATEMQLKNIRACKYQYYGMKKGLWQYGLIVGQKTVS